MHTLVKNQQQQPQIFSLISCIALRLILLLSRGLTIVLVTVDTLLRGVNLISSTACCLHGAFLAVNKPYAVLLVVR